MRARPNVIIISTIEFPVSVSDSVSVSVSAAGSEAFGLSRFVFGLGQMSRKTLQMCT